MGLNRDLDLERAVLRTALESPLELSPEWFGEYEASACTYILGERPDPESFEKTWPAVNGDPAARVVASAIAGLKPLRTAKSRKSALKRLRDAHVLREGEAVSERLADAVEEEDAEKVLTIRAERPGSATVADSGDFFKDYEWRRKRLLERKEEGRFAVVPSGVIGIDDKLGGLRGGELGVVIAPINRGKSVFLLTVALAAWVKGWSVLHFGTEMAREESEIRADVLLTQIAARSFRLSSLNEDQLKKWDRTIKAMRKGRKNFLHFAASPDACLDDVFEQVERAEDDNSMPLGLLVVDALYLIRGTGGRFEKRHEKEDRNAARLKEFLREREIPGWTAAQVASDGQSRRTGMVIEDTKYGKGLGERADFGVALYPGPEAETSDILRMKCVKARGGQSGWEVELMPDMDRMVLDRKALPRMLTPGKDGIYRPTEGGPGNG